MEAPDVTQTEGRFPLACGGAVLFPLPSGPSCAGQARALLAAAMIRLGLPDGLIEDAVLAVSELATNAHLHTAASGDLYAAAELWIWLATRPHPQLVVSVFDTDRTAMPRRGPGDLLDEQGKGLCIVELLATAWGAHPSRSRLAPTPRAGKRVWFKMTLPGPWPGTPHAVSPAVASKRLLDLLRARGIDATRTCDDQGIALVTTTHLNIWVEPKSFAWCDGNGGHIRHPHLDLHETVEEIVATIEKGGPRPPLRTDHAPRHHLPPTPPPVDPKP